MHTTESTSRTVDHPPPPTGAVAIGRSRSDARRRADLALVVALVAPLGLVCVLMAFGVSYGIALCIVFVALFVTTTAMDVAWRWRRHDLRQRHQRTAHESL